MIVRLCTLATLLLFLNADAFAAATVRLKDGSIVIGKILNLADGEDLVVDTEYMDEVTIEWDAIDNIEGTRPVVVELFDGTRITGPIYIDSDGIRIGSKDNLPLPTSRVFSIEEFNQTIWDGVEMNVDLGMNIVRGNNTVTQISSAAGIRYDGPRFETGVDASAITNEQLEGSDTRRFTLGASYTFKLKNNWTISGLYSFESDEQQNLDGRTLLGALVGRRVINNRRVRLEFNAGSVLNAEQFSGSPNSESLEGALGSTIRWRSSRDIDLDAALFAFPNLEQSGRWRAQLDTSLSIDLWGDLDFKVAAYSRYDTDPPEGNSNNDWGTTVGLSWKYD